MLSRLFAILVMALMSSFVTLPASAAGGGVTPTYYTVNTGISCNSRTNPCPTALRSLHNVTSVACTLYTCMVTYADCGPVTNDYVPFYNENSGLCDLYHNMSQYMICYENTDCSKFPTYTWGMNDVSLTIEFYCDKLQPNDWGTCSSRVVAAQCCDNGVDPNTGYCL